MRTGPATVGPTKPHCLLLSFMGGVLCMADAAQ